MNMDVLNNSNQIPNVLVHTSTFQKSAGNEFIVNLHFKESLVVKLSKETVVLYEPKTKLPSIRNSNKHFIVLLLFIHCHHYGHTTTAIWVSSLIPVLR